MGTPDVLTQAFMRNPQVFADAFNLALYNGKQVIQAESLMEVDPTQLFTGLEKDPDSRTMKLYRDVIKLCTMFQGADASYLLLGIENQTKSDLLMPLRVLIYDALTYYRQIGELKKAAKHGSVNGHADSGNVDFLTGLPDTASVYPVLTMVFNFSSERWIAPTHLHETSKGIKPDILSLIPDYHFILLDPHQLSRRKIRRLKSDLQIVCECFRLSSDRTGLRKMINKDPRVRHLDELTARMINQILSLKIQLHREPNGEINMCKAWDEILEEERNIGEKLGLEKGEKLGLEKGEKLGLEKGEKLGLEKGERLGAQMTLESLILHNYLTQADVDRFLKERMSVN